MCVTAFLKGGKKGLVVRAQLFPFLPLRSEHQHLQSNLASIIGLCSSSFGVPLLITIPPLLGTHLWTTQGSTLSYFRPVSCELYP